MFDLLTPSLAHAADAGADGLGSLFQGPLPMLILMFVIFYFLLIRPQQKKAKAHKQMLGSLRKGDKIMTSGGIFGTITGINDQVVVIEIAPQVRIKISRGAIGGLAGSPEAEAAMAQNKKK